MKQTADLTLDKLICIKSQESEDEPYLWAFYFKLDGSNIKQVSNNLVSAISTIRIESPAGSGGNLVFPVSSGQSLWIPKNMREFSTTLTDIHLIGFGNPIDIPGMICCLVVLIEEDAVPRYAMEDAHQTIRTFFEQEVNKFVMGLNFLKVIGDARTMANKKIPENPSAQDVKNYLKSEIDKLKSSLNSQIKSLITSSVLNSMISNSDIFSILLAIADPDDRLGVKSVFCNVPDIINSSLNFPISLEFKDANGKYNYLLTGNVNLRLDPDEYELQQFSSPVSNSEIGSGKGTITDTLCLKKSQNITWQKIGYKEEQEIWWDFASGNVRWTVEGTTLTEGKDSVTGNVTALLSTWDPVFNGYNAPGFYDKINSMRYVNIGYKVSRTSNRPHIQLYNDPADGNYSLEVSLELLLPDGKAVSIDQVTVDFGGAAITIPDDIRQSLDKCHIAHDAARAVNRKRFERVKKVAPGDLWGPNNKIQLQKNITEKLTEYAVKNKIKPAVIDEILVNVRQNLNLEAPIKNIRNASGDPG